MSYPLGMVYDETNFIIERQNSATATETLLMQQAINALLGKDARKQFTKTLKSLNVTSRPIRPMGDPNE
jgi:hypothetical protein